MSKFKENVSKKYDEKRNDIQAAGFVVAILAATYYLGKSRGKTNVFVWQDSENSVQAEIQRV